MTATQRSILRRLVARRPKTAAELASAMVGINPGAVARSLRSLMQRGMVEQVRMGTDPRAGYGYRLVRKAEAA